MDQICIVAGIYPPETGGPAKFASSFSNWLLRKNCSPSVITLTNNSSTLVNIDQVEIRKISRKSFLIIRYLVTAYFINRKSKSGSRIIANGCFIETWLAFLFTRRKYIAKVPGDIVWERAITKGLFKCSLVEFQSSNLPAKYKIFRFAYSRSLQRASMVIVPTKELKQICKSWGVSDSKISVIYNSVATNIFSPVVMEKKFDVITLSRLVPWKNIDMVITTCAELSLTLAVIGDGPQMAELKQLALNTNADVTFFGNLEQKLLPELLNSGKIFVLNSTFEASSYALLEARACGLVAIARSKTGSEEVIQNRVDGFLINEEEGLSLKNCLNTVTQSDFGYSEFSLKAISRTRSLFNIDDNYAKIYKFILES